MKNILIPTDFSIKSLRLVNVAVERFRNEELNITLVHALEPDRSISGMLLMSKRLKPQELCSEDFIEACEVLRNKYGSTVAKLQVEFYYGETRFYRNNFLEARDIDAILFASDYTLALPSKQSGDMRKIFANSRYPIFNERIVNTENEVFAEENSLSVLLQA